MSRMTGAILLVGSVPAETATEAMRTCAEGVGPMSCLPDGETGYRSWWINFLAARLYHGHPALETLQRPNPIDGKENWIPQSYDDFWRFKVKAGVSSVQFDGIFGYAHEAQQSYQDFCTLRAAGVIPADVRFQVSLPLPEDATRGFLTNADDFALLSAAYEEAIGREIGRIIEVIPPDDLAIQWDICSGSAGCRAKG